MMAFCHTAGGRVLFAIVGLAAAVGGCAWGGDNSVPVNPSEDLKISSTYPPDASTGPFDLYTPKPDTLKPHFTVHFNRLMKLSTLNQTSVTCEGFPEAASVRVLSHVPRDGDIVGFHVTSRASGTPMLYAIGGTYTVTIRSTAEDYLGNRLGSDYRFTFTPEPYFRVTGFSFGAADTIIPAAVEVYFNSRLPAAIRQAMTIDPPISDAWSVNAGTDSTSVAFATFGRVVPSTIYTVAVAATAADAAGDLLHEPAQRSFHAPPIIISKNQFGSAGVNLAAQIVLSFNHPMEEASIAAAFSLEPAAQLVREVDEFRLSFTAANDFVPETDYTVRLSTALTTLSGAGLPAPKTITFRTAAFAMSHHPADNEVGVSTHNVIELDFTGAIIPSTATGAISISPPVSHRLTLSEGTPGKYITIFVVPEGLLLPFTEYTVVVSNAIASIGGYHLAEPDTFSFRTSGSSSAGGN